MHGQAIKWIEYQHNGFPSERCHAHAMYAMYDLEPKSDPSRNNLIMNGKKMCLE